MIHYTLTIIGKNLHHSPLVKNLRHEHNILFIEESNTSKLRYRNHIKTEDGYLLILWRNKKSIQATTNYLINLNIDNDRKYAEDTFAKRHAS